MLYPSKKIGEHLSNLEIKPDDTIMVHGDAGIAAQYIYENDKDPIEGFFGELNSYISNGTILVPSFTYSATKGEIFDVSNTPSEVGLFSEKFRLLDGVQRSQHPIFSVCALGKYSDYFTSAVVDECFGEGTFFDRLYNQNVKIVTLGCALERITFVHFVEQRLNVPYRYLKKFSAQVTDSGISKTFDVSYFVRDLKIDAQLNFTYLECVALREKKIIIKPFGRFKAKIISSNDFFQVARQLLIEDQYALVRGTGS